MALFVISALNGLSYGLLLFMLSSGLTVIYSMMGVLNFAHAGFYMLGAYLACSIAAVTGYWPALLIAPLLVGIAGAAFERFALRRVRPHGHVPEMLMTFGLFFVLGEAVQLAWGRSPLDFPLPALLDGAAFTLVSPAEGPWSFVAGRAPASACQASLACLPFPASRAFIVLAALAILGVAWAGLVRTRAGLVIQAAITHPQMAEVLGHDVPRVFTTVFGAGAALAGLAGAIGGSVFVTEPSMAVNVGSIVFVVVVGGGLGSLAGAFVASMAIGLVQTFAAGSPLSPWAPVLPYLALVGMLLLRPSGLLGRR